MSDDLWREHSKQNGEGDQSGGPNGCPSPPRPTSQLLRHVSVAAVIRSQDYFGSAPGDVLS
ncbi:hypothetical protein E2C01_014281 [Portunus trituberculatus]|uniref:Uncharacterized protein n=1 Tax=Portunus trituberculatus TaxID=210409 RepID=A0A5B7DJP1_PORTR|nr:hypothetical protein [Portunus trituberculatus]